MSQHLYSKAEKQQVYETLQRQILSLIEGEDDVIAIMASISCVLKSTFSYFDWVGFYRSIGNEILKIGPYQGGHGCLSIPFNKGVCGQCAQSKETQVVDDVNLLPYHIACSSSTVSEIVVPWLNEKGELIAVLDIDSDDRAVFDEVDKGYLEELLSSISLQMVSIECESE